MTAVSSRPTVSPPTVVFVHAHPDDEAIFTGIAIRRLADRGGRVILVTGTLGEEGQSRLDLPRGTSMGRQRLAELERSCAVLGVHRLVLLRRRDSGVPGSAANRHRRSLHRAPVSRLARRVADLVVSESAGAVVHDDPQGIYGHPDHRAGHRIGAAAAALAGVSAYEVTVDRERIAAVGGHLVSDAGGDVGDRLGRTEAEIGFALRASAAELHAKGAAMAVHASQIDPARLDPAGLDARYGTEWFTRTRGPAVLERLEPARARVGLPGPP